MSRRTGIPTTISLAHQLCRAVVIFDPLIRKVTNNDPAVLAALAAAMAACQLLVTELETYLEQGD